MGKAITPVEEFKINIGNMEDQFKAVLPKHIKSEKFVNVVVTAIRTNPKLLTYNRQSLFNACMDCAQDGLLPNGSEAALVPFKGNVKYMPMVTGITKKARNSGEIVTIDALVVYENDNYDVWVDEKGPHFKHKKSREDRGNIILTYAYAITKDGGVYHEEIDEKGMDAIQKCCKASDTPWKGPFKDEMRRKSALRRLCKYRLPSSTDMDSVIRRDDDLYDLDTPAKETTRGNDAPPAKSSLEKAVGGKEEKEEIVDAEYKEEVKEPEGKIKKWNVEGKITALVEKQLVEKTKYGCKIAESWYGSFSSTVYGKMIEAEKQNCDVKIIFQIEKVGERKVNNIVSLDTLWPEEVTQPEEKADVPNDEIAI